MPLPLRASLISLALLLASCKPPEQPRLTAIVGAVLFDGTGGPPISDSVVTIEGNRIRAVGNRANLPIPATAEKIDGSGKFLVPGLIDLQAGQDLNAYLNGGVTTVLATGAERRTGVFIAGRAEAAGDVAKLAARHVDAIEILGIARPAAEAILDESRKVHLPVAGEISSLADARFLVDNGAAVLRSMIRDTENLEPAWIAHCRDLQVVFAPQLARLNGAELDIAKRNTRRLAAGGVPVAVASSGDTHHEIELLADAGLTPGEVLVAATRTGALGLRQAAELGTIEPGKLADLLLLTANPAEDVANLRKVGAVMLEGQWVEH